MAYISDANAVLKCMLAKTIPFDIYQVAILTWLVWYEVKTYLVPFHRFLGADFGSGMISILDFGSGMISILDFGSDMISILNFGSDIISISPDAFIGRGALGGDFGSAVMAAFVRLSHQHYVHYLTYQCFALHFITFHKPLSACPLTERALILSSASPPRD